ncbi:MAG: hypothetical protein ACJASX_004170 [Limisphaerales bacterium]|jgi:hypothetical protein
MVQLRKEYKKMGMDRKTARKYLLEPGKSAKEFQVKHTFFNDLRDIPDISSVGLTHHKEQLRFSQSVLASVRPLLNEPCVAAISFS